MEENNNDIIRSEDFDLQKPSEEDYEADEELPPPEEENDAREINIGNIIALIAAGFLIILLIAFTAAGLKNKKKSRQDKSELDKAGTKTVIEFKEKNKDDTPSPVSEGNAVIKSEEELDSIIDSIPVPSSSSSQGETGKAPVAPTGSTTKSYSSDRPDTRNSRSPRKIEGLAAQNYSTNPINNDKVSSIIYNSNNASRMSKEEFISNQMQQTKNLEELYYGNQNSQNSYSDNKESFFNSTTSTSGNGTYLSKSALWDGTIISGALITAINTDNPGVVIARVTENVYSSQDHSYLLIPEGSLLMATYNSSVSYGQNKVQVAWNLLIRPDNYRITLGNMNGTGSQGESGYTGSVSNHPWETMKALGLIAVYSFIQTEAINDINSQNNEYLKNMMSDVYSESSKIGNKMVDRALDIKPTIKIKEGTEIKLITNIPLELPPVEITKAVKKYIRTR